MSDHPPQQAKILNHSTGAGVPTSEAVRRRAQELARIDGRTKATETDWRHAKAELHGGHNDDFTGEHEMISAVSESDMVSGALGHRAERHLSENEDGVLEELVAEGMDEADHEQRLEWARNGGRSEEDSEEP